MSWNEIRSIAERCFEKGVENMARDGRVKPTYFMVTPKGVSVIPVEHRFSGERERRAAAMAMQKIARERSAGAVLLISQEGQAGGEGAENLTLESSGGAPGEQEVLRLSLGLPDGRGNLLTGIIVRDKEGMPVEIRECGWAYPEPSLDADLARVVLSWEKEAGGTVH